MVDLLVDNPLLLPFVALLSCPIGRIRTVGSSFGVASMLFAGIPVSAVDEQLRLPSAMPPCFLRRGRGDRHPRAMRFDRDVVGAVAGHARRHLILVSLPKRAVFQRDVALSRAGIRPRQQAAAGGSSFSQRHAPRLST